MLRCILLCAFASISSSYNVPDHKPTIEDPLKIPQSLFANKHAPTYGSGVLQLQVKVHDGHLEKLNFGERRKRQSSDPLANIINGYTIDSTHPLRSWVHLKSTLT